ncbi:hypothetical protein OESDEN_07247 [Oesophagostomum dentatum]|uniref:Uncharacterized protein n=1 Tax=Oesophagostomum dentatum TaxID=61180 RepID=A0A0B1TBX9_OESDE|nr:hypothetical protein OESDEN_07247 [Oesophagostomum dentatum]
MSFLRTFSLESPILISWLCKHASIRTPIWAQWSLGAFRS